MQQLTIITANKSEDSQSKSDSWSENKKNSTTLPASTPYTLSFSLSKTTQKELVAALQEEVQWAENEQEHAQEVIAWVEEHLKRHQLTPNDTNDGIQPEKITFTVEPYDKVPNQYMLHLSLPQQDQNILLDKSAGLIAVP